MKRILFLSLIMLAAAASLFAQETITGIAADLPILMHRSQATPSAFPLPWRRSIVMYEIGERKFFWSFGWGKNLETELGRGRYGSNLIHSYSLRWKVPVRSSLNEGIFASANYRPYDAGGELEFSLGCTNNLSNKLSLIPSLRLQGSAGDVSAGFGATWVPLRTLAGHLGAECIFEDHGALWRANLTLKGRLWKGLFFEDKFTGAYESHSYYSTYTNQPEHQESISLRQELYLGIMF